MRTRALSLLGFIIFAPICLATPSLDPAPGNPTHGQSFTLSGSGFGTKVPAAPVLYANFEHGSNGSVIGDGNPAVVGDYHCEEQDGQWATFSTGRLRPNSTMSGRSNYVGNEWHSTIGAILDGTSEEMYVDAWLNYDDCDTDDAFQVKIIRAWPTGTYPNLTVAWWCRDNGKNSTGWEWTSSTGTQSHIIANSVRPGRDEWGHLQVYAKHSSAPGVADGKTHIWRNGQKTHDWNSEITHQSVNTGKFFEINLGEYYSDRDQSNVGCGAATCDAYIYWDNVYIDRTPARVEIGNDPVYENCTHREIQIPTAWSQESVTVTVNQGAFADGSTVYMFVTDPDGNVSNGVPVTVSGAGGGGGTGDTVDPDLTVSGYDVPDVPQVDLPSADYIFATIQGSSSDDTGVAQVTWTNSLGGSGTASGTTNWVIDDATVYVGTNVIQITARDMAGNARTETVTIVSDWPGRPSPVTRDE